MHHEKITELFDRQASTYDEKWSRLSPINGALHLLTGSALSDLPAEARILCVGAGTGAEVLYLAGKFPGWHFTAVEPSAPMLDVFRTRAKEHGISDRCFFHAGYLDSLPTMEAFDAATAFLVSQFILDRDVRSMFFSGIAGRLRPGGVLVSSDLACDFSNTANQPGLLDLWFRVMNDCVGLPDPEAIARMREAYQHDVAVLPPFEVRNIIARGGFESPMLFFQAGMIHAWHARISAGLLPC